MSSNAPQNKEAISLKGSTALVSEFFGYSVNNILYQRGVYPAESFTRVPKYGLALFVTTDEKLKSYISGILAQLNEWLMNGRVRKLVLVISNADDKTVLERWIFDIETDKRALSGDTAGPENANPQSKTKDLGTVRSEIAQVMRQITASITFLPLLDSTNTTFDILVYTDDALRVPRQWEESGSKAIPQPDCSQVKMRAFDTGVHTVETLVSYRLT